MIVNWNLYNLRARLLVWAYYSEPGKTSPIFSPKVRGPKL